MTGHLGIKKPPMKTEEGSEPMPPVCEVLQVHRQTIRVWNDINS